MPVLFLGRGALRGTHLGALPGCEPSLSAHRRHLPADFRGIIETDDGAEVIFDYRGYGRAYPAGRRQIVTSAPHPSEDERYRWLNDSLSVGVGEVRAPSEGEESPEPIIEWSGLVWEPLEE